MTLKIIKICYLIGCLLICLNLYSQTEEQEKDKYKLIRKSNSCVLLKTNGTITDTLSSDGLRDKLTFIKIKNKRVFTSDFIVPGAGSFVNTFLFIRIWQIENSKFHKTNSLKIKPDSCYTNKIKFVFKSDLLLIKYSNKIKRQIAYTDFDKLKMIELDCQ